jgi:transcriptional regulator with XRE-family HTH domain
MAFTDPADGLRAFRDSLDLSLAEAARQLGVSHVTLRNWERGALVPSEDYRRAIETWTGGAVPADAWPVGERERRRLERVARVQLAKPAESGPLPTGEPTPGTGTDGD